MVICPSTLKVNSMYTQEKHTNTEKTIHSENNSSSVEITERQIQPSQVPSQISSRQKQKLVLERALDKLFVIMLQYDILNLKLIPTVQIESY